MNQEVFCKKCGGKGFFIKTRPEDWLHTIVVCKTCKGKGKLDWIEKVVGVSNLCHDYIIVKKFFTRFKDKNVVRIQHDSRKPSSYLEYGLSGYLKGHYRLSRLKRV